MLLDGYIIAQAIRAEIKAELQKLAPTVRRPSLACVLTTKNPASAAYVKSKVKACHEVGIESQVLHLEPRSIKELLDCIEELNKDPAVDGILIQLPLPPGIPLLEVLEKIDPSKDVDGFHPLNAGKVLLQDPTAFNPCTPLGIKVLLERYGIECSGKHVVILGRSTIVGRPLATLLMQDAPGCNATVTVAHSRSKNLKELTCSADIIVAAMGQAKKIGADYIKEGAVVVDVGINRVEDASSKSGYKLVGDVDFENVKDKCFAITPVPGGVGPMTIAMLLKNTLKSYYLRYV